MKIDKLLSGQSLQGGGYEVAYIDLVMGPGGSDAEALFAQHIRTSSNDDRSLLITIAPNTVVFNKTPIMHDKHSDQIFGPAQHGIATAVVDCVMDGVIPACQADDLFICVGVFVHHAAEDDIKIQNHHYRAARQAIQRALHDGASNSTHEPARTIT